MLRTRLTQVSSQVCRLLPLPQGKSRLPPFCLSSSTFLTCPPSLKISGFTSHSSLQCLSRPVTERGHLSIAPPSVLFSCRQGHTSLCKYFFFFWFFGRELAKLLSQTHANSAPFHSRPSRLSACPGRCLHLTVPSPRQVEPGWVCSSLWVPFPTLCWAQ